MSFPSWVTVIPYAVMRFFAELDKYRAKAKQIRREDRLNGIKKDPDNRHSEYFGASSGRVSVSRSDADIEPE